jgi:hypothetical protein
MKSRSRSRKSNRNRTINGWTVIFKPSTKREKKMMAIFRRNDDRTKTRTVHFGARGMSDYTIHKDKNRRDRYDARHTKNENWNDPFTAGSLSKWILWNKPSKKDSIRDYKKKFGFK